MKITNVIKPKDGSRILVAINGKIVSLTAEFIGGLTEEKNPMHYCLNCDKYLGHRGFCSTKCHDKWYDEVYPVEEKKTLSDKTYKAIVEENGICAGCPDIEEDKDGNLLKFDDVKEAIKELRKWANIDSVGNWLIEGKYIKEIFGERLI